jgi:TolB-like protein/DNA-binding winged helix-turn-helix (wHTH) protein
MPALPKCASATHPIDHRSLPAVSPIRFGAFEVDLQAGELRKNGLKLKLQGQPIQVLAALLERPGKIVTREELRQRLWAADTYVDFEHNLNSAVKRLREALGDSADNPRFIETLPRHGYRIIAPVTEQAPSTPLPQVSYRRLWIVAVTVTSIFGVVLGLSMGGWRALWKAFYTAPIHSLAVLPLENLSRDPQDEYFAESMTDELITELGKIRSLRVISRQSVMHYKGTVKPLSQIADELHVDALVQGSALRDGDRVRITTQLIRAAPEEHLWAESYERDSRDVLTLQAEIAGAVAREIKITLTPQEAAHLARARPVNPEAYEAYLKGQSHWYRLSREHLDAALGYFELSLQKDPNYARAYVGIANVWLLRGDAGFMPPTEAFPRSRAAVARALQLDNTLAEAHITNAINSGYDRDWSTAESEYRHGIELNPNSADGHFMYADFLISMKREAEWNREIHRTLELDPFNPFFQCFYGWHLVYLRRYDEAIARLQKVLSTEPAFSSAHMGLWVAYHNKGMDQDALEEARKFFAVLGDREVEEALTRGYAEGGYAHAMHLGAEALATRSKQSHVPAVRIARLYAHSGDKEEVLRWLQRAYDEWETPLAHLGVASDWDFVRTDPRFQDLLHRMKLPQ